MLPLTLIVCRRSAACALRAPWLQALQAQLSALEGGRVELSELRSCAYAAVHRVRQALHELGAAPTGLPEGCEPGLPQQLKGAVDGLLAALQEHGELVAAFQQHLQQQPAGWPGAAGALGSGSLPADFSQRAVIRSLAAHVADLQQRLEQGASAGSPSVTAPRQRPPAMAVGGDLAQLAGMCMLVRQQLSSLERIQRQLEGTRGGAASPSVATGSAAAHIPSASHAAALLGTELPALRATVEVMEALVRSMASAAPPARSSASPGTALCLPPPVPGPAVDTAAGADMARRKEKWKARCKEVQAKLEAAATAAQQVEAALRTQLADAERAAAQHAAQQAGTVEALQGRVEQLAAAGAQLEGALQEASAELATTARATESLQQQLQQQAWAHAEAERRAAEAQSALEDEQRQHASLAASLQELVSSLQSSGGAEETLRAQLAELAERVAVLTAAQVGVGLGWWQPGERAAPSGLRAQSHSVARPPSVCRRLRSRRASTSRLCWMRWRSSSRRFTPPTQTWLLRRSGARGSFLGDWRRRSASAAHC